MRISTDDIESDLKYSYYLKITELAAQNDLQSVFTSCKKIEYAYKGEYNGRYFYLKIHFNENDGAFSVMTQFGESKKSKLWRNYLKIEDVLKVIIDPEVKLDSGAHLQKNLNRWQKNKH